MAPVSGKNSLAFYFLPSQWSIPAWPHHVLYCHLRLVHHSDTCLAMFRTNWSKELRVQRAAMNMHGDWLQQTCSRISFKSWVDQRSWFWTFETFLISVFGDDGFDITRKRADICSGVTKVLFLQTSQSPVAKLCLNRLELCMSQLIMLLLVCTVLSLSFFYGFFLLFFSSSPDCCLLKKKNYLAACPFAGPSGHGSVTNS